MRKLLLQMQTSLDGYVATTDGATDWMVWNWGPEWHWDAELQKYHNETIASVDTILLSRKMLEEGFIEHWADVAKNPGSPQSGFASHIATARKVVFSRSAWAAPRNDVTSIAGNLASEVNELKRQPGGNLISYGGAGFASSLIAADLVEEFHLIVNPVLLGNGLRLFDGTGGPRGLEFLDATPHSGGILVARYAKP